ncbi:FAD-binding domain-containing protein [Tothia fuscella]|uniref:FAD-binding domain-containing protein n=1 Tax=Tothia fuscella TaxID=1048955 RepID=A0A9P4NS69_9PEZI|nr:FAD-binding domain-containing protein [Tothia fuscella]
MPSLLSFVSVSLLSLSTSVQALNFKNSSSCKVLPSTPQWPSETAWAELNRAVAGRLSQPLPLASVCHSTMANYNPSACEEITDKFKTGSTHANHPTSSMWQNYNNYSCMPEANAPCSNDGFPLYVVTAQNAEDVKAAIDFARTNKVRLNIKSTGHDFLGRSVQPNSLSIYTHNMKSLKWFDTSFTPKGCTKAIPGAAVTAGAGSQWGDLTSSANSRDVMLVAGASRTVSLGGFLSNGGHGSLSAYFGLGADMVLEIDAVTADGKIIKANECQNQDLFWAMRGGGGSTFAVATAYTMQAPRTVPTARYRGRLNNWDEIVYMHKQWPKLAALGVSGYINGYPARGNGGVSLEMTMPNATSDRALEVVLDPILAGMGREGSGRDRGGDRDDNDERRSKRSSTSARRRRSLANRGSYSYFKTWAEASVQPGVYDADEQEERRDLERRQARASFPGTGSNKIITSWMWSTEDCAHPNMAAALKGAFDTDTQLLNDMTMGVGTWKTPYMRGGGNAVNPAFRTATMRPAAELQWSGTNPATLKKKEADALRFGTSLRSIAPNGGTYANEADPNSPDWQHAFWGSNYERLFAIKKSVDPEGVFYCRACVGSELWSDNDGQLCKN